MSKILLRYLENVHEDGLPRGCFRSAGSTPTGWRNAHFMTPTDDLEPGVHDDLQN